MVTILQQLFQNLGVDFTAPKNLYEFIPYIVNMGFAFLILHFIITTMRYVISSILRSAR